MRVLVGRKPEDQSRVEFVAICADKKLDEAALQDLLDAIEHGRKAFVFYAVGGTPRTALMTGRAFDELSQWLDARLTDQISGN